MKRILMTAGAVALLVATACRTNDAEPATTNTTAAPATTEQQAPPPPMEMPPVTATSASTAPISPLTLANVARINSVDAKTRVDAGTALIIDVRSADAYREGHIKGAKNIPLEEMKLRDAEIPRGKFVITYCT